MLRKIKVRWNTEETQKLQMMGIETTKYDLKEICVNTSLIAFLEDFDGFICITFGGNIEQSLITDLEYNDVNIARLNV